MSMKKAANQLNVHDKNRSIRSKIKKSVPKPVLCTPYKIVWPQVEQKVQENILNELEKFFSNEIFKKPERLKLNKKSRKQRKQILNSEPPPPPNIKPMNHCRKPLAIGLQEVTKHAEKNNLSLVIVDRSSPWQLHRHLIQLSRVRDCPAVALDQFSERISPLLSILRICALGFKKEYETVGEQTQDMFKDLVNKISPLCPKCELPWLDCEEELMAMKNEGQLRTSNKHVENNTKKEKVTDIDSTSESEDDFDDKKEDDDRDANLDDEEMVLGEDDDNDDDEEEDDAKEENEPESDFTSLYIYKSNTSKINEKDDDDDIPAIIVEKHNDLWDYKMFRSNILFSGNRDIKEKSVIKKITNSSKSSASRKRKFQDTVVAKIHKNEFKNKKRK